VQEWRYCRFLRQSGSTIPKLSVHGDAYKDISTVIPKSNSCKLLPVILLH